jgi:hypothetical protein
MKELLPYIFYIAGSICFLLGSIITILQKLEAK